MILVYLLIILLDSPLDLLSSSFYESREKDFEDYFNMISNSCTEELAKILEDFWNEHNGEILHAVDWNRYSLSLLQTICCCFGGELLSKLFRIVAQNYKASRSGMPDLLLWKITPSEYEIKYDILFSEVKGPRDRLSAKQYLWIHRMLEANIPVEVLHVKQEKDNKT